MEVTKRIEFECCYVYKGDIHAHRYKLEVTVQGPQRYSDQGVVLSFDELSNYMKQAVPDKAFIYWIKDAAGVYISKAFNEYNYKTLGCDFPISAENICAFLAANLQDTLNVREPGILIVELKLREDNNSFVSWKKEIG